MKGSWCYITYPCSELENNSQLISELKTSWCDETLIIDNRVLLFITNNIRSEAMCRLMKWRDS